MKNIKKILPLIALIMLIVAAFISCDKRFLKKQEVPVPISIAKIKVIANVNSDTIKLYTSTKYGEISLRIDAFGNGDYKDFKFDVKFKILTPNASGDFRTLLGPIYGDTAFSPANYHSIKYYPTGPKGWHSIEVLAKNGAGQQSRDTVKFYVDNFESIPFSFTLSTHDLGIMRPNQAKPVNLYLLSSDISLNTNYYVSYSISSITSQAYFKNDFLTANINQNQVINYLDNKFNLQLNNHIDINDMWLVITVKDSYGDSHKDSVIFDVRANAAPIVTAVNITLNKACSGYYDAGVCTSYPYGKYSIKTLNRRQSDCLIYYKFTITANDVLTGHPNDGLVNYKIYFYNTAATQTGAYNTSVTYQKILSFSKNVLGISNNPGSFTICPTGVTSSGSLSLSSGAIYGTNNCPANATQVGISVQDKDGTWSPEFIKNIPIFPLITAVP